MAEDMDIARRLVAVREHYKLQQQELAAILHIAKNTLNEYENGKRPISLETARRIHARYNISVDWLLFGRIGQPRQDFAEQLGPTPAIEADTKKKKPDRKRKRA